jgi:hypothetical protein
VGDAQVGPGQVHGNAESMSEKLPVTFKEMDVDDNTAVIDRTLQQCTDDRNTEDEDEECDKMAMDQKHDHTKDREVAMMNRNKRQEVLAMKAMKQYWEDVEKDGATTGAVVSLKVDYRTHSHAYGLLGIVYKSMNKTGGILVACEHGVITSSGSSKDFWVPSDRYKVVALANQSAAISNELQRVRDEIIGGRYDYAGKPRISYAKYHDIVINATSPTKKGKCSCKKGCNHTKPSCLRKGLTCHSGCGCNGNCEMEM